MLGSFGIMLGIILGSVWDQFGISVGHLPPLTLSLSLSLYIYIYTHIYRERERERERDKLLINSPRRPIFYEHVSIHISIPIILDESAGFAGASPAF